MASLSKALNFGIGADLQDLAHQRVARACGDGAFRMIEGVIDELAAVPHQAVFLLGREIVGWAMRHFSAYGDRMFDRGVEIVEAGGRADPVEVRVDFFVPSSFKWKEALFRGRSPHEGAFEIRKVLREPQKQERWSSRNYVESAEWDHGFAFSAESGLGGLRVCTVERKFGSRGADLGPQLIERFLTRTGSSGDGWWLAPSAGMAERAREEWRARLMKLRGEPATGAGV